MTTSFAINALRELTPSKIPIIKSLVIDDNLINGKILSKILTKEFKHQVKFISSGSEALNLLSQDIYDLEFDNRYGKNKAIPIFAYTTNEWEEEFLNAGMNRYIWKLTCSDKVKAMVETVSHRL
ncbi:CheY-like protein [Gigaspora margarita]|uniref:CheY-like protein n=1 Tax=Gigaspora margarita TaxID=4874 RepID=A0A8H3WYF5_GIGMA|nr:CheY-like protein [Gigaspora margarita]